MQLNDAAGGQTETERKREVQNAELRWSGPAWLQTCTHSISAPVCVSLSGTVDPLQSATNSVDP